MQGSRHDSPPAEATARVGLTRHDERGAETATDLVTREEPLEIRVVAEVAGRRVRHSLAVTMRTPGQDLQLAAGFLLSEGVVRVRQELWRIEHCHEGAPAEDRNIVEAHLGPGVDFDLQRLSRSVITTSACGVCGKASIEAVAATGAVRPQGASKLSRSILFELPEALLRAQPLFSRTGGLHAAALFDSDGKLLRLHEDVGRHNALDKLTGALLFDDELPASERVVLVSGRASFELVQKALAAGIPTLAAVGAPSSLAVELAAAFDLTLVGFLRNDRFNVYTGAERVLGS